MQQGQPQDLPPSLWAQHRCPGTELCAADPELITVADLMQLHNLDDGFQWLGFLQLQLPRHHCQTPRSLSLPIVTSAQQRKSSLIISQCSLHQDLQSTWWTSCIVASCHVSICKSCTAGIIVQSQVKHGSMHVFVVIQMELNRPAKK